MSNDSVKEDDIQTDDVKQINTKLTDEELKICGQGTKKACFAIVAGPNGKECLLAKVENGDKTAQKMVQMTGITLGWRINQDETDGKVWCPKGMFRDSKS